ncbi:MAG TPA: cation:dicarboxylase symporter family transporter [Candidatus Deferrimicrobium sp.]|nr:cation:dicarboxylase symporter family transporter [Candidatus Deferrimicrobium sp.]
MTTKNTTSKNKKPPIGFLDQKKILILLFITFTLSAFLMVLKQLGVFTALSILPPVILPISRWIVLFVFFLYGLKKRSMTTWILISMLIGAEIGNDLPGVAVNLRVLSLIFLRLIKTIIAPLIFSTLVVGIASHSDLKQVGRMGIKSIIYFEIVTTLALFIGVTAINISHAGDGIKLPAVSETIKVEKQTATDVITHIFPENIAKSVAEGQILQVVIFAIIFGIALALVPDKKRSPILNVTESLSEVMFKFTNIVMFFAPFGVGAAIAYTVGHMGFGILANLFKMLVTFYAAIAELLLFVLLPVSLMIKLPLKKFVNAMIEPVALAFATTSSEAALPKAMAAMESIGVPRKIVAFVMPTGYSFNLDGSSLYLSLAGVFVAQAAGISMSFGQQLLMVFTLMLTSKGVAGVPRASLVILLGTVAMFNLPTEPVFILLGIDELMDMGRTATNVIGNSLATAVVARWEGELKT